MVHPLRPLRLWIVPTAALVLALAPAAGAQEAAWFSPDNSPPGTPAQLMFDEQSSSPTESFFDVYIHGFYYLTRTSPSGQSFTQLVFPGLPRMSQPGAPDLPAVQAKIAVLPGASEVVLGQVEVVSQAEFSTPNPCWPTPIAETDTTAGTPEQFVTPDPKIYGIQTPWPASDGDARISATRHGGIPGADLRLYPVHWNPSDGQLTFMTHVRYQLIHDGTGQAQEVTKDAYSFAQATYLNWALIRTYYPPNGLTWMGDYLIVTETKYAGELAPLATQKAARGYAVTVHLLSPGEVGNATAIRSAIVNWYASTSPSHDHYALLVGDTSVIPFGYWGFVPTDDLYADADNDGTDDLDQEVYVGRLSADDEADVANQVTKWLDYEDHPHYYFNYGRDLLIGNKQNAPGKYVGCLESVAAYGAYVIHPAFTKLYGSDPGNDNSALSAAVNSNYGIVTYRGHGDWDEWWNWDLDSEDYYSSDVDALTNSIPCVVWSIACSNAALNSEDCFGEHWMERPNPKGAVAFYGATEPSDTDPNHILTRALHRAVFQHGFTKHGRAIAYAESQMYDSTASLNSPRYLLLGDPDMDVRRFSVLGLVVARPPWLPVALGSSVTIKVLAPDNRPIPNALVAAYKPPNPNMAPARVVGANQALAAEFFDNHYTDANGEVTLQGDLASDGWLYYGVRVDEGSDQGDALLDSIPVGYPTGVVPGVTTRNRLRAFPSLTSRGTLFSLVSPFERDLQVVVSDVAGRVVRELSLPRGALSATWDGRSSAGTRVASGIYFAKVRGTPGVLRARVTVLH